MAYASDLSNCSPSILEVSMALDLSFKSLKLLMLNLKSIDGFKSLRKI